MGGGPTGLLLRRELRLAGVKTLVSKRLPRIHNHPQPANAWPLWFGIALL
jgi:hypothetical protein